MSYRSLLIGLFMLFFVAEAAHAKVAGRCSTCHTMHNSQNTSPIVQASSVDSAAGWNGSNELSGGDVTAPQGSLLVSNCVGCHTSSTSDTIIDMGDGMRTPIVYNTVAPVNPLAGGNFYHVVNSGDQYGHNVRDISNADTNINGGFAPGQLVGCADSCHESLTLTDEETVPLMDGGRKNGCQGCHQSVKHHGNDPAGQPVTAEGGWYRFLSAPSGHIGFGGGVHGVEDPDWEQTPTSSAHNTYYGGDNSTLQEEPQSIGRFCAGCHYSFHSPGNAFDMVDNGGGANPWLRHPANAFLPNSGEYTTYTTYDPVVPVGRPEIADIGDVDLTVVRPGTDKVICISCHRAHGSPYPDMLRWDYQNDCVAGTANADCGCFTCHSDKD